MWHAAEDLVQTSLVKLYRARPKPRLDGDPDAYLRRIMVNTRRSWWRARRRREMPADDLPETVIADFAEGHALGAQALQALPRSWPASKSAAPWTWTSKDGPGAWSSPPGAPARSMCSRRRGS